MTVGGQSVDLVKLFLIVKKKGGYKRVTENGLWDVVAKECGFSDVSDGLALKLVYAENLDRFLESLKRVSEEENLKSVVKVENSISDNCSGCPMDFSSNLEPFLSEVCEIKMKKDTTFVKVNSNNCDSDDVCVRQLPEMVYCHDPVKSNEDIENYHTKCVYNNGILDWGGIPNVNEECHASSGGCLMDMSSHLEPFLSEDSEIKKKDTNCVKVDNDECDSDDVCVRKLPEMVYCHDPVKSNEDIENYHTKCVPNNVKEECLASVEFKSIKTAAFRKESVSVIDKKSDSTVVKEDVSCLKRKRESAIGILDWIHRVARDPCDPAIGSLPECSEWKNYATDIIWKQVLLIHEAMLLKRNGYSNDQHFNIQKRQRMQPTMYEEPEKPRHSPRILSAKDPLKKSCSRTDSKSSSQKRDNDENPKSTIDFPDYLSNKHHEIRVNIGRKYQADVHEWTEKKSPHEVDSNWSGTPIWPLGRSQQHNKNLTEHESLIGKGRSDSCGCRFPGSTECVRYHVSEKGKKLRLELGVAFYLWRFNGMGESTSVTWRKEDENKFLDTWKLNPVLSLGGFLDQTLKALPNKSRASLVNYYFNVVLLRRRGEQNRTTPNNITSDDDIDEDDDDDDDDHDHEDEDTESQHVKAKTLDSVKKTQLKKSI